MAQYKTPGVYIVEKNAFPNSVVEVATAVPAFIGYTESASYKGQLLSNKPWRISSMADFVHYFGGAPTPVFKIVTATGHRSADFTAPDRAPSVDEADRPPASYRLERTDSQHLLYQSMQLFFQNGGGACYVVSVGDYGDKVKKDELMAGIDTLLKEQEPTMLVVPDAVRLSASECFEVQKHMLAHCGYQMKNRFAILDVHNGGAQLEDGPVDAFREGIGANFLAFGAAYYPWVNSSIVALDGLNFSHLDEDSRAALKDLLTAELEAKQLGDTLDVITHKTLSAISPLYGRILLAMQRRMNLMPPSAAMAGVYSMVDNTRGVWKAPANVALAAVTAPAVNITHAGQEELNVDRSGKSINAIRSFIGEGTLVWGARTLDGNSLDWRYINVRRTLIMLEESLRLACKCYVFEPNVANTWVTIKSMVRNFLTGIWKRGGLAGASPDDAFSVAVGLGETMTPDDILEGVLRVTVLVAVARPAEFIEISLQQQMQKS
jgi:phage tail sheath protein FI